MKRLELMAKPGRPRATVDAAALAAARREIEAGRFSIRRAAAELGISRATLRALLQSFCHTQEPRNVSG